jgi:hypothetical protein
MAYVEVRNQAVRNGGTWDERVSIRRFREVDLVLSLNSGPPSLPTPSKPKCQKRAWFPFMECKINRSSTAGEGPTSPAHNARAGGGGRGEKQLFFCLVSIWH